MSKKRNPIAVIDFETDPFQHGESVAPFCAGFYDGNNYEEFWGDDCITKLIEFLHTLKTPHYIYAHNGGKFDFIFLLRAGMIENPIKIIHGRIVSAKCGIHTFRDSYAILPVALKAHEKETIDYDVMKKSKRESHKNEILKYLRSDCVNLFDFVTGFIDTYGIKLTAASMAYGELKKKQPQAQTSLDFDERFRPFYFGGHVEYFDRGILPGDWKVFDVNSMYPFVMRNYVHPSGPHYIYSKTKPDNMGFLPGRLANKPYFCEILADSAGALPIRTKQGLDFPIGKNIKFFACSHEIQAGIETGKLNVKEYGNVRYWMRTQDFAEFIDPLYSARIEAKKNKDKAADLLIKLQMNSSYGKFALNPREYKDYQITGWAEKPDFDGRNFLLTADYGDFCLWEAKAEINQYTKFNNVAIAASITSAARAELMRGIHKAVKPIYCDTDSLICHRLDMPHDGVALGDWKLEAEADLAAIAGKKLYALFSGGENGECVKMASKGVRISPSDMLRVCRGESVTWQKESPAMGLNGEDRFIKRQISMI